MQRCAHHTAHDDMSHIQTGMLLQAGCKLLYQVWGPLICRPMHALQSWGSGGQGHLAQLPAPVLLQLRKQLAAAELALDEQMQAKRISTAVSSC